LSVYKKKIAIVISSLEVGGAEKMILDLIDNIKDKVRIKLFVIKKNYKSIYDLKTKELGIKVYYLNHKIKVFSLMVAFKLKKLLDQYQPDIIHTHLKSSTYIYFYNLFNKSFIWIHTMHTLPKIDTKVIRRFFFKPLYNKNRVKLVAVSSNIKNAAIKVFRKTKIRVIYNGIDLEKFEYNPNVREINLINVARMEYVKNHDYLLKEVSKLNKDLRINKLILIGDGKRKNHINALINKLKLKNIIQIIPYTSKVGQYLNKANIFILTSYYEGLPLAVIEAMASGLIVIASLALKDIIIDNYNGFLINLDEDELYLKLKDVINNLDKYEYIRKNAYKSAIEFNIKIMARKYLELYLGD
jgi:glycosyltransferase involved in cell wall biosynthesis